MNTDIEENENLINQEPEEISQEEPEEISQEEFEEISQEEFEEISQEEPEEISQEEPEEISQETVFRTETVQLDYSQDFIILENLGYIQISLLGALLLYFVLALVVKFLNSFF